MKFLCALCVLCGFVVPGFSLDRSAITFTNYDLQVRIEPAQHRIAVRGKITLRNDSDTAQETIALQISSSLEWHSILIDGKPAEFVAQPYISDIDHTGALSEAIVSLPRPLPPKAGIELQVGYEGVVVLDTTRLTHIGMPEAVAESTDWDQIGKSSGTVRGLGHVAWYPVATPAANLSQENSVPETVGRWMHREASSNMRVEYCLWRDPGVALTGLMNNPPTGRQNGDASADSSDHENCRQYQFSPLGHTTPLLAFGGFENLASPGIEIAYLPEHKAAAENFASGSEKVLPFVTNWFGSPKRDARVAELAQPAAGPYESGGLLLTTLNDIDPKLAEITAVHQRTHAAFPSPRLWIYEGLAHFAQAIYQQQISSREDALRFMGDHLAALVEAEQSLTAEVDSTSTRQSLLDTGIEELYRSKAMYVWWMLRDMLGDSTLKRALSNYRPEADTEPSYMQHLLEGQSKRNLQWFFDDWVYHDRGLPDFKIDSVYPSKNIQGSYLVTVTVENIGGAGAEVPVTLRSAGHEESKRLEVRGKSKSSIRFVTQSPPSSALVNDGSVPESDTSNNSFTIPTR